MKKILKIINIFILLILLINSCKKEEKIQEKKEQIIVPNVSLGNKKVINLKGLVCLNVII